MKVFCCLIALILLSIEFCSAQLVINGGFEIGSMPPFGGLFIPAPDSSTLNGWIVSGGSVDYIDGSFWPAAEGSRSLDMNGHDPGTITQNVSGFAVGQPYRLSFYLAANNDGAPFTFHLQAGAGSTTQTFPFDATGHDYSNMGWSLQTLDFTASNTTLALTFTSLDVGNAGPALDNITITSIPEPSLASLLAGAAAAGLWRRINCRRH